MKRKPLDQQVNFLQDLLRSNVAAIAENEGAVDIATTLATPGRVSFVVRVHYTDMGLVLGEGGATADAIRRVVWVACKKTDLRADIEFVT